MKALTPATRLAIVALAAALSGCGGSSRRLTAISITPDPAIVKNGSVQLIATGTFSESPLTVTPLPVNWQPGNCNSNVCPQVIPVQPVQVSSSGVATCLPGFHGTFTIEVTAPADPSKPVDTTTGTLITGTGKVTCP